MGKEYGILFNSEMVNAILQDRKTMTRRIVKPQPEFIGDAFRWGSKKYDNGDGINYFHTADISLSILKAWAKACPYGQNGDRLYVRESGWECPFRTTKMLREGADTWAKYYYDACLPKEDHKQLKEWGFKRRPSIHMPRWASRITLEITSVRVERLNDITPDDCYSEGIFVDAPKGANIENIQKPNGFDLWSKLRQDEHIKAQARCTYLAQLHHCDMYVSTYKNLWKSINGENSWDQNPWVWMIEFKKMEVQQKITE